MAKRQGLRGFRPKLISIAVASCFVTGTVLANPTGPTVVNGTAAILQNGNLLQVTNSPSAIINWQSFSIGASEITRFIQQSQASAVLNRVTGSAGVIDPSVILGALQSNGRVFLINPSGVLFGAGAQIDVAGLVATSLNLSNSDFLANRLKFTEVPGAGSIVNRGNITTGPGGNVYLIGSAVTNNGIIASPQGEVVLAAGNSVELVNPGTPNLRVEIVALDNEARNLGQIMADSGRVGIYAGLINNSGAIRADSAVTEGGRIVLKATKNVTLENSSILSAQGQGGGEIKVLAGEKVQVAGRLDASAPNGGDGGFIETSAANIKVDSRTVVTAAAPYGKAGTWLIDPVDIVIDVEGNIDNSQLASSLNNNPVVITTDDLEFSDLGNITVAAAVSWNSGHSLTLIAHNDVNVNAPILNGGAGGISLYAGWDGGSTISPTVTNSVGSISLGAGVTTGGEVHLVAGQSIFQTVAGVITADKLLADAGYVSLNGASNMVNTLAGRARDGSFYFTNGQSLTIGTVGGVSGITADTTNNCCSAQASVTVTAGDLTVNQNIAAFSGYSSEGGAGSANINLYAQNGSITVQNGAVVSAAGADVSIGESGSGGYAYVSLSAQNGGSITVAGGSRLEAVGGMGRNGYGGGANVNLNAANSITVSNASVVATGGRGQGGSYGYDGGEGYISLNASANIVVNSGSLLEATAGDGAYGGYGQVYLDAQSGISVSGSTIKATGGAGLGFFGSNCSTGCNGYGGQGYVYLYNSGTGGISISNSSLAAKGGNGAAFARGGYAQVYVQDYSATGVDITGSTILASGGPGGETGEGYVYIYSGTLPSSNISVSSSSISADGAEGSIYLYATNISAINSTLAATGDGTGCCGGGSSVDFNAGGMIDTSGSTLSAVDAAGDGYVDLYAAGNIILGNLVTDTAGSVYVQAGGSITDGNSGLNVQSPYAYLYAGNGIGTIANPLETLVGQIYLSSSGGEIGVINADNLFLSGLYLGGTGAAAVGATGAMNVGYANVGGSLSLIAAGNLDITLDGGEGLTAGSNMFLQGANVNIGSPTAYYYKYVNAAGLLSVSTPGNFTVQGGSGQGASTMVMGGSGVNVVAGGNVVVQGGSDPGASAHLIGSPDVHVTSGGTVSVNPGSAYATIESRVPATIYLDFPNNAVGDGTTDFSVAGVTSAIVDGAGTSGFFAGGAPAILDVNLIVTPRGGLPPAPPGPPPEALLELPPPAPTQIHDPIFSESGQSTGTSQTGDSTQQTAQTGDSGTQQPGKEEKKTLPVCR